MKSERERNTPSEMEGGQSCAETNVAPSDNLTRAALGHVRTLSKWGVEGSVEENWWRLTD